MRFATVSLSVRAETRILYGNWRRLSALRPGDDWAASGAVRCACAAGYRAAALPRTGGVSPLPPGGVLILLVPLPRTVRLQPRYTADAAAALRRAAALAP